MQILHIEPDSFIRSLVARAYPQYKGNKFKLYVSEGPIDCRSCWDGGSRDYFAFANLATGEVTETMPAQSAFDRPVAGLEAVVIPPGFACLEHSIFCGVDAGITIWIRPENAAKLIPAKVELTREENIVLVATRSLKSSYGGLSNYRFHEAHSETGITREAWESAKQSCMDKGLLNKAGALTVQGRNAAGTGQLYQFRVKYPDAATNARDSWS